MKIWIIGQGIAGTWLSYWFRQFGAEVVVFDTLKENTATRIAGGVINPVTGRQVVTTWLAETLLPFAEKHYTDMGSLLQQEIIRNCGIIAFPPNEQMAQAYAAKISGGNAFVKSITETETTVLQEYFRFHHGAVHIHPAYWVDLQVLLMAWRGLLEKENSLREEYFAGDELISDADGVFYRNSRADYVFFCDGIHTAMSPYWRGLPFSFNKGEALTVNIPGLPGGQIYKIGITTFVPWHNGLWWVGSTYDNHFTDDLPGAAFRKGVELFLESNLKLPFSVEGHYAAIRPATVERRPFAGLHPVYSRVGILGGLGTKGVSLAPWLAKQVAENTLFGNPIAPAAHVQRFRRAFES